MRTTHSFMLKMGVMLALAGACGDDSDKDNDGDAGAGNSGDASTTPDTGAPIETGCSSYGMPKDGMCGGYYCKQTEAQLAPTINPNAVCGGDPAFTCNGRLTNVVGACARKIKSAMPTMSNAALRPMIQACVYEDTEVKQKVTEGCLSCFLDSTECAGDNCLLRCLGGDSADCDACRLDSNCTRPVFACGGLPDPFAAAN